MVIAVTGPRHLAPAQRQTAAQQLRFLLSGTEALYVGDAEGLDLLARNVGLEMGASISLYEKKPDLPCRAQGAERSTRMVKALAATGGTLHAWPAQPMPLDLKPCRNWPKGAGGSGTWGTIALAVGLGVPVELHPLTDDAIAPAWLLSNITEARQLQLI